MLTVPKDTNAEIHAEHTRSDNRGFVPDVIGASAENAGTVVCGGCGRTFRPDATRKKFCDHDCYSASLRISIKDRFWSKVNIGAPTACWLWIAKARLSREPRFEGYGSIIGVVNGKRRPLYSHRVAWELTYGPIPDDLCVLHRCDVSLCCNPSHLFLGTQADNLDDARQKGRLLSVAVYRAAKLAIRAETPFDRVFERVPHVDVPIVGDLHVGQSAGSAVSEQSKSFGARS